jgi:predicted kinase
MKKAIITVGVSASGKSTWADQEYRKDPAGVYISCRDDIRKDILTIEKGFPEFKWADWSWKWEDLVTERQRDILQLAYKNEQTHTVIIADTNLNSERNNELIAFLQDLGFQCECKFFNISFEEAVRRDAARQNGVGAFVLGKQFQQWHKLTGNNVKQNLDLPKAILVDIDGTLAHMEGRKPFEWHRVEEDKVDQIVRAMVNTLSGYHEIIVLSGRDSVCRIETEQWLNDNHIMWDKLLMRPEKDNRPDEIIKKEFLDNYVRDKYFVEAVIDDRPKVCRMWRSLGLKVIQVADPYVEF